MHNASGIDLQGEGHYVVAPPSLHPSGKRYRWAEGQGIDELSIADAPEWLYDYLEEAPTSAAPEQDGTTGGVPRKGL